MPVKLLFASSNPGKLAEFRSLARSFSPALPFEIDALARYATLPRFAESAPTFAENALGKALHYSRLYEGLIFADDSGLVVPALGGAPGVQSARYAGPQGTSPQRIERLLAELRGKGGCDRAAHFLCAIALAERGRARAVVSGGVDGEILEAPRGSGGFGYDPVFFFSPLGRSFAELSAEEKNAHSHRGKAFRRVLTFLASDRPT